MLNKLDAMRWNYITIMHWHTLLSCWWWLGMHSSGQLNWEVSIIPWKLIFSTITTEWYLRLFVAPKNGIQCNCSKMIYVVGDLMLASTDAGNGMVALEAVERSDAVGELYSILHPRCPACCPLSWETASCPYWKTWSLNIRQRWWSVGYKEGRFPQHSGRCFRKWWNLWE